MKIENEFTVSIPIDRAWEVLTDLERIAPCMPGAQLTGVEGTTFSGKVKVKVGPVTTEYAGTASFAEKDDETYSAVIAAKGRDSRGAGNATATIVAQLRSDGERTRVSVDTDLKITGKVAQFGSGMIAEVSEKLLGQFVDCLETKLANDGPLSGAVSGVGDALRGGAGWSGNDARPQTSTSEPVVLDLLDLAGTSVAKRAVPLAVCPRGRWRHRLSRRPVGS